MIEVNTTNSLYYSQALVLLVGLLSRSPSRFDSPFSFRSYSPVSLSRNQDPNLDIA
jgi:hypothetical protein